MGWDLKFLLIGNTTGSRSQTPTGKKDRCLEEGGWLGYVTEQVVSGKCEEGQLLREQPRRFHYSDFGKFLVPRPLFVSHRRRVLGCAFP